MIILSQIAQFKIPGESGLEEVPIPSGIPTQLQGGLQDTGKNILQTGLSLLFIFSAVLALIFIIYSGIQWITSEGDPGKIAEAKRRLFYSIIGLIIVAGAFLIVKVILSVLGVEGTQSFI